MLRCPVCKSSKLLVRRTISYYPLNDAIVRERKCKECGQVFTTQESVDYNYRADESREIIRSSHLNSKKRG